MELLSPSLQSNYKVEYSNDDYNDERQSRFKTTKLIKSSSQEWFQKSKRKHQKQLQTLQTEQSQSGGGQLFHNASAAQFDHHTTRNGGSSLRN